MKCNQPHVFCSQVYHSPGKNINDSKPGDTKVLNKGIHIHKLIFKSAPEVAGGEFCYLPDLSNRKTNNLIQDPKPPTTGKIVEREGNQTTKEKQGSNKLFYPHSNVRIFQTSIYMSSSKGSSQKYQLHWEVKLKFSNITIHPGDLGGASQGIKNMQTRNKIL